MDGPPPARVIRPSCDTGQLKAPTAGLTTGNAGYHASSAQSPPCAPAIRFGAPKSLTSALLPVQDSAPLTVLPTSIGPYSHSLR